LHPEQCDGTYIEWNIPFDHSTSKGKTKKQMGTKNKSNNQPMQPALKIVLASIGAGKGPSRETAINLYGICAIGMSGHKPTKQSRQQFTGHKPTKQSRQQFTLQQMAGKTTNGKAIN